MDTMNKIRLSNYGHFQIGFTIRKFVCRQVAMCSRVLLLIVLASVATSAGIAHLDIAHPETPPQRPSDGDDVIASKHEDLGFMMNRVKDNEGTLVGFKLEVTNYSSQSTYILVVRERLLDNISPRFFDPSGHSISARPSLSPAINPVSKADRDYRYETVFPKTSHAWFLSLSDLAAVDENVSQQTGRALLSAGKYDVEFGLAFSYATAIGYQESEPESSSLHHFRLTLPKMSVVFVPDALKADVLETYKRSTLP
jgi:hypothetical protein